MILDRVWASGPEARLLPAGKLHGPTVSVMAIMTFAMLVVAAAGLALANAAGLVISGTENRYVVEIPAASVSELPKAIAAVKAMPSVRSATPVPEREMRRTLERWLGEAARSRDLPVPALVTLDLAPNADVAAVGVEVRQAVPSARLHSESTELQPLLRSIHALQWLAVGLVLLMAIATGAAIVLAARGALDTHRSTIDIMHGIGATDRQLTRLFERKIAVDAIAGAAAGAAAAVAVLIFVGGTGLALAGELTTTAPLGLRDLLLLAVLPVAAVILAVAVARRTLLGALRANL